MKKSGTNFYMIISVVCFVLVLSGCISVHNSLVPRFYMLGAVYENKVSPVRGCDFNEPKFASNGVSGVNKKINIVSDVAAIGRAERDGGEVPNPVNSAVFIGVGPVKIPEYLDRPQIVTRNKEKMLKFSQFDRWGESLSLGIARLIGEGFRVMLPGTKFTLYPWNLSIPVKYQVVVEIVQLDSELDKDLFFVAQWLVIDTENSKTLIIKRSELRLPIIPQNYSGLAKTLSMACASLSSEISGVLATLEAHSKTKD